MFRMWGDQFDAALQAALELPLLNGADLFQPPQLIRHRHAGQVAAEVRVRQVGHRREDVHILPQPLLIVLQGRVAHLFDEPLDVAAILQDDGPFFLHLRDVLEVTAPIFSTFSSASSLYWKKFAVLLSTRLYASMSVITPSKSPRRSSLLMYSTKGTSPQ